MRNKIQFIILLCTINGYAYDVLSLSKAYELALKNERHLRALALKTNSGLEQVEQSRARLYPQLQGSLSWGRYGYQYPNNPQAINESYTNYSLSASQPIFHPELWRGVDEAKSRQKMAEYQFQADTQQLGLDLAKAYFAVLYTQRNLELIASQKVFYEEKYKQLDDMLKVGLSNKIDLLETKVQLDKATSTWLGEKMKLEVAKMKLNHLTGEHIDYLETFEFESINTSKLLGSYTEWKSKIIKNPTLNVAIAAQESAMHNLAVREYEHYPKIDVSFTRKETYTQDQISHKYDNQAVAQMSIPIFQGGYTQSRVREGRLLLDSAREELDYYQKETLFRFEELWAQRELNIENVKVLKESQVSAELSLKAIEKANKVGLKSVVDILEAKQKLYEIRRDLVDGMFQLINNQLGLLDITGELNVENISAFENALKN